MLMGWMTYWFPSIFPHQEYRLTSSAVRHAHLHATCFRFQRLLTTSIRPLSRSLTNFLATYFAVGIRRACFHSDLLLSLTNSNTFRVTFLWRYIECRRGLAMRILSVLLCQTLALWQNGRKICPGFLYHTKHHLA